MKICFLGGGRYGQPLNATSEKKFRLLTSLEDLYVIGFSQNPRPRRFTEHAHFYLLPYLPLSLLRYAEMFILGPIIISWLIFRHGVRVLIAQGPHEGFAAACAKTIANRLGYKTVLVVESHGDFVKALFLQRRIRLPSVYRFLMRQVARFTLARADVLRAVSSSTRQQLEQWAHGQPIHQFLTWTDIDPFFQAGATRAVHSSQDILYAGVLTPLKGVHHLINAFTRIAADFPQARLLIVGREENKSYAAELKEDVRKRGLESRIQFLGAKPQTEVAELARQACMLVLPTYSEGLPRVVVEGMAAGLPIIATPVGGIPEVLQDGVQGFLVPPGDEAVLAQKLHWILAHPVEAQALGSAARSFAERFFSTATYVQGYRQVFATAHAVQKGDHAYSAV